MFTASDLADLRIGDGYHDYLLASIVSCTCDEGLTETVTAFKLPRCKPMLTSHVVYYAMHWCLALAGNATGLPAGAVVTGAELRLRASGVYGANPFTKGCPKCPVRPASTIQVDMSRAFNNNPILEVDDIRATATVNRAAILVRSSGLQVHSQAGL